MVDRNHGSGNAVSVPGCTEHCNGSAEKSKRKIKLIGKRRQGRRFAKGPFSGSGSYRTGWFYEKNGRGNRRPAVPPPLVFQLRSQN